MINKAKELCVIHLPQLDKMPLRQAAQYLDANVEHQVIDCANWSNDFPYKPSTTFVIAVSATRLYVFFSVISKDLRAINTEDLSPVADDSCVEFFMLVPGNEEYWNFELNCIGTLNGSHRVERPSPTRLTAQELASIQRYASCGNDAIEDLDGTFCWDLIVSIPLELVKLDGDNLPEYILGNFYKCAGKTAHPHYVSWSSIDSEKPNFHRPDCFGKLWFKAPEPEKIETQSIPSTQSRKSLFRKLFGIFNQKNVHP